MTEPRNIKKVCARLCLGLFLMMFCWLGAVLAGQYALGQAAPHLLANSWVLWLMNDLPLYAIGLPVFLLALRGIPDGPAEWRQPARFRPWQIFLVVLFCLGATYLLNGVSALVHLLFQWLATGRMGELTNGLTEMAAGGDILANFLFGVCVPAFGEEFLFRYTIRRKMRGCADSTYILFSGFVFALFHANLTQMLYAFVLGALFAWVYTLTNHIGLPVALHFTVNLVGIILAPLAIVNETATILLGAAVLLLIIGAAVVFCVCFSWAARTLAPPQEAGWPYRPRRRFKGTVYGGAPPSAYGPWPPYGPYSPPGAGFPVPPGSSAQPYPYTQGSPFPYDRHPPSFYPPAYNGYAPTQGQVAGNYPYGYPPPQCPPPAPEQYSAARLCLGNVGMVLYLVLVGLVTGANLMFSIGVL